MTWWYVSGTIGLRIGFCARCTLQNVFISFVADFSRSTKWINTGESCYYPWIRECEIYYLAKEKRKKTTWATFEVDEQVTVSALGFCWACLIIIFCCFPISGYLFFRFFCDFFFTIPKPNKKTVLLAQLYLRTVCQIRRAVYGDIDLVIAFVGVYSPLCHVITNAYFEDAIKYPVQRVNINAGNWREFVLESLDSWE